MNKVNIYTVLTAFIGLVVVSCATDQQKVISVKADYMLYACGDNNFEMKVSHVSDSTFNFLIDQDVTPVSSSFWNDTLYGFIDDKNLKYQLGEEKYLLQFEMLGYLKNEIGDCARYKFIVQQIRYGNEVQFLEL